MKNAVTITNLSSTYGADAIVKDVSFTVDTGEFCIILGPNGSGKTTLLKTLAGLLPSCQGQIQLFSRPLPSYSQRDLAHHLAYVPQNAGNDSAFTVEELVLMGRAPYLGILGIEGKEDRTLAKQAMADTGIISLANRRLHSISGGERQRAHIARAICQHTGIILLDEPTASLDPGHQIQVMNLMQMLKNTRETTVIMVSHDLNLAAMYADHLLLLTEGRIRAYGRPEEVIREDILSQTYGCPMLVDRSPAGNWPRTNLVKAR